MIKKCKIFILHRLVLTAVFQTIMDGGATLTMITNLKHESDKIRTSSPKITIEPNLKVQNEL
jgi:hypothetical protein